MLKAADQSQDLSNQDTHRLMQIHTVPEYVKRASVSEKCGSDDMPRTGYADPLNKLYPSHKAPATWLSAAFYYHKVAASERKPDSRVEAALQKAAAHFGITADIDRLRGEIKKAAEYSEELLSDDDFALVIEYDNNTVERKWPMRNPLETKHAAEYLCKYRDQMPYTDRQKFAEKVLNKAAAFGTTLGDCQETVVKVAGHGMCSASEAAAMIRSRGYLLRNRAEHVKTAEGLFEFAKTIEEHPSQLQYFDKMAEVAGIIDQVDREAGLVSRYGSDGFGFPEDTLFGLTEAKVAEATSELVTTTTGNFYKLADLENVPLEVYTRALGELGYELSDSGILPSAEKLAAIIPTLPLPDAERLDLILESFNVKPAAMKSAATGFNLLENEQVKTAAQEVAKTARPGSLWAHVKTGS
jgi:hypothetical protein